MKNINFRLLEEIQIFFIKFFVKALTKIRHKISVINSLILYIINININIEPKTNNIKNIDFKHSTNNLLVKQL